MKNPLTKYNIDTIFSKPNCWVVCLLNQGDAMIIAVESRVCSVNMGKSNGECKEDIHDNNTS